ncbi:MAG: hypothetical protein GY896_10265 [Gammaproteobacteria bacterium]|nr:hypothetical protein [Gammaproteobacteria bacterium]
MTDRIETVIDARDLRRAFGNFATGVSIVTTLDAAIIAMLERYIREKKLGNYRVYIGDQDQREVHPT